MPKTLMEELMKVDASLPSFLCLDPHSVTLVLSLSATVCST